MSAKILVVDDVPANVKLLTDLLNSEGYQTCSATNGADGLARIASESPDMVLLDVRMPGMSGYDVCRAIRGNPDSQMLPVVLVTGNGEEQRYEGLEAGADDFLTKPFIDAELLARVRSLLRVKTYYDQVQAQAAQLRELNRTLERRVEEGAAELERVNGLKRFFSPQLVSRLTADGNDEMLRSHRREIVVVFLDLRGFTAFAERSDPEEVMRVLREYHASMGTLILQHEGTIERFAGDGIMIFFNDPMEVPDPAVRAGRMALQMQIASEKLAITWKKRGYNLGTGIGIAQGYATIGMIGFEGRRDYSAIGTVCNLSARLCGEAKAGQVLVHQRVMGELEEVFESESAGELTLKGFADPQPAYSLLRERKAETDGGITY